MKKALISTTEPRLDNDNNQGFRVAFVCDEEFDVASPLFWVECPDDCEQDKWVYVNNQLVKLTDTGGSSDFQGDVSDIIII